MSHFCPRTVIFYFYSFCVHNEQDFIDLSDRLSDLADQRKVA